MDLRGDTLVLVDELQFHVCDQFARGIPYISADYGCLYCILGSTALVGSEGCRTKDRGQRPLCSSHPFHSSISFTKSLNR